MPDVIAELRQLLEKSQDKLLKQENELGRLRAQLEVLQERYEKLKHPEVVRSEIERLEKIWSSGFSINISLTANLKGHTESAEIRRQKWLFILENSTIREVDFLRSTILFSNLEPKYLDSFSTKKLRNLKGYDRQFQFNFLLKTHLSKQWKHDIFIEGLLQFLNGKPCNLYLLFNEWKQKQFEDFALKISVIYGEISTILENGRNRSFSKLRCVNISGKKPANDLSDAMKTSADQNQSPMN